MKPKKTTYRLEKVVEVRRRELEEAARRLKERQQSLDREKARLRSIEQELESVRVRICETRDLLSSELDKGSKVDRVVAFRGFLKVLGNKRDTLNDSRLEQLARVRDEETALDEAIAEVTERNRGLKIIEKHRSQWASKKKKAAEKEDQKLIDEIGGILRGKEEGL